MPFEVEVWLRTLRTLSDRSWLCRKAVLLQVKVVSSPLWEVGVARQRQVWLLKVFGT